MDYNKHRRRTGLILGLMLGVGYSLSSNLINDLALPGVPLYTPPPGQFMIILLTALGFGLLGMIATWSEEALPCVLVSGLAGSFLSSVWILMNETSNRLGVFALLMLVFLPRMFFYIPLGALVRWLVSKLDQPTPRPIAPVRRLIPIFVSFLAVILLGTSSVYPKETRTSLINMEKLIKTGLQASTRTDLPRSLQSVEGFIQYAEGEYYFTVGSNPDVLPVQRPIVTYGEPEPFIIIRFKNGFRFGCVFSPSYVQPACIDF